MTIYKIDLNTLDQDPRNQLLLEAEAKYALATDCTHLLDSNDMLFEISEKDNEIMLDEVCVPCTGEPEVDDCDDYDDCEDSIEDIINLIIRNSLLSSEPIRKEQADTMLVLAQLKHVLANS